MYVPVYDSSGLPLKVLRAGLARRLLREKRATIEKREFFSIRLNQVSKDKVKLEHIKQHLGAHHPFYIEACAL